MESGYARANCKLLAVLLAAMVSGTSFATSRTVTGQKIISIQTGWGGEGIFVTTDTVAPSSDGCGGSIYFLPPSAPLFKEIVALAMTAKQSGEVVDIHTDGCLGTSMVLKAVNVRQS